MNKYEFTLVVAGLFSSAVAVSALMVARQKTSGWLVGVMAQAILLCFAVVTATWTMLVGPCVVGPVFVRNWLLWRRKDKIRASTVIPAHADEITSPGRSPELVGTLARRSRGRRHLYHPLPRGATRAVAGTYQRQRTLHGVEPTNGHAGGRHSHLTGACQY